MNIWNTNNLYFGDFEAGKPEGEGIEYFANGDYFIGSFKENLKEGRGVLIYEDGRELEGWYKKGQYHGT